MSSSSVFITLIDKMPGGSNKSSGIIHEPLLNSGLYILISIILIFLLSVATLGIGFPFLLLAFLLVGQIKYPSHHQDVSEFILIDTPGKLHQYLETYQNELSIGDNWPLFRDIVIKKAINVSYHSKKKSVTKKVGYEGIINDFPRIFAFDHAYIDRINQFKNDPDLYKTLKVRKLLENGN